MELSSLKSKGNKLTQAIHCRSEPKDLAIYAQIKGLCFVSVPLCKVLYIFVNLLPRFAETLVRLAGYFQYQILKTDLVCGRSSAAEIFKNVSSSKIRD
jgi:hypothetical protein